MVGACGGLSEWRGFAGWRGRMGPPGRWGDILVERTVCWVRAEGLDGIVVWVGVYWIRFGRLVGGGWCERGRRIGIFEVLGCSRPI